MKEKIINKLMHIFRYSYTNIQKELMVILFLSFIVLASGCAFYSYDPRKKYNNLDHDLSDWMRHFITGLETYEISPELLKPMYEMTMQKLKEKQLDMYMLKSWPIVGNSPLMLAALYGDIDGMCELLKAGLPVNETSDIPTSVVVVNISLPPKGGESALHYAARGKQKEAYDFLVRHGADEFLENARGEIPMACWGQIPPHKEGEELMVGEDGRLRYKYNQERAINDEGFDYKASERYDEWAEQQRQNVEVRTLPNGDVPKT